jgi:hypothetical protein
MYPPLLYLRNKTSPGRGLLLLLLPSPLGSSCSCSLRIPRSLSFLTRQPTATALHPEQRNWLFIGVLIPSNLTYCQLLANQRSIELKDPYSEFLTLLVRHGVFSFSCLVSTNKAFQVCYNKILIAQRLSCRLDRPGQYLPKESSASPSRQLAKQ